MDSIEHRRVSRRGLFRNLFKVGTAVGAGVAMEAVALPTTLVASYGVEKLTDQQVGNAAVQNSTELTGEDRFFLLFGAPVMEELLFRTTPSLVLSTLEKSPDPLEDALHGSRQFRMTRREAVVGTITSTVFSLLHNFTPKGFDTKIIPLPQAMLGFSQWYLQRKFGIIANLTSHTLTNLAAILAFDASNK